MGIGVNLVLIAVGAVLAFACRLACSRTNHRAEFRRRGTDHHRAGRIVNRQRRTTAPMKISTPSRQYASPRSTLDCSSSRQCLGERKRRAREVAWPGRVPSTSFWKTSAAPGGSSGFLISNPSTARGLTRPGMDLLRWIDAWPVGHRASVRGAASPRLRRLRGSARRL
jgi:hypothetical protein